MVGALVGAFGFWLRGSSLFYALTGRGATTARLVAWAFPMGVVAWFGGIPTLLAAALFWAFWLGSVAPWWGSLDLGRGEGAWRTDALAHLSRGVLWTLPAGVGLIAMGYPEGGLLVAASGLAALPAYELGWTIRPPGTPAPGATEIGELLTGAAIGAAVGMAGGF